MNSSTTRTVLVGGGRLRSVVRREFIRRAQRCGSGGFFAVVRREFIRRAQRCGSGSLFALGLILGPGALAQNDPPAQVGIVTKQLFPDGSGGNGYADFVLAGEYARSSQLFQKLVEKLPKATLTEKRKAMNDPAIVKALQLLRRGLNQKIESPHKQPDENTLFPELALFRQAARILMVEQYVLLSEGRVNEAIASLRDGLRFGYVIQSGSLIHGLVGIAIDAMVLDRIARHIDQLSVRDCDRLIALANEWMKLPDPLADVYSGERDMLLGIWRKYRASPADMSKLFEGLKSGGAEDNNLDQTRSEVEAAARSGGQTYDGLIASCMVRTTRYFDSIIGNLRLPPWERKDIPEPERESLAGRLCGFLLPAVNNAGASFIREQATIQILGVHAAIRKYRWEHDQLPTTLNLLNLGRLIIDPFTGDPLTYRITGETTYELSSAGPIARSEEQKAKGARVPIHLPRKAP